MRRVDPLGPEPFYAQCFFDDGLHLACPRCAAQVIARFDPDFADIPIWERRMRLACGACSFVRTPDDGTQHGFDGLTFEGAMPNRAELWAVIPCCGEQLIAVNRWHAAAMRGYIEPGVRPDCRRDNVANQDWRSRLPRWMKRAANRSAVLRGLDRIEARFEEKA